MPVPREAINRGKHARGGGLHGEMRDMAFKTDIEIAREAKKKPEKTLKEKRARKAAKKGS